ncbi:MAG: putative selenate reductase subunit YgfK [Bacteroidales bacterium]|jgi:putative selenate reductase|nr:putative selenate reductase subunit YgfK [Bacteroidales bacterium]
MSDKFSPFDSKRLYKLIFSDFSEETLLGIPRNLFFNPSQNQSLRTEIFQNYIDTPYGVAAGPHTQMAQNIIAAWLCGARYIELKTIQTIDELDISKPCIDMQDEGYNCEWSQELKIEQSYIEYLKAWIFIHLLSNKLGYGANPGTIFNMSVGYNMEGILKKNVQWYLEKMNDCSDRKEAIINEIYELYPEISEIKIPDMISNNITLSTMHGCPREEIEKIGSYLIEEKKLHTFIKLNPTLLGPDKARRILNIQHGYKTVIPDIAFEHDLKYTNAVKIIKSLSEKAQKNKVFFGVKLTNTLECSNHRNVFSDGEKMMYMSGKGLHPLAIHLAKKLQNEFNGCLHISFSGGADCFNINKILSCGIFPITVCSDILKPGGYGRLFQYAQNIKKESISKDISENLTNLNVYAEEVIADKKYSKEIIGEPNIKTSRKLSYFDCINAPCIHTCPTHQDIPLYMQYSAMQRFDKALQTIIKTNPLPAICGLVCDHECQGKCTRINYDDPLMIREIKRFITEQQSKITITKKKANNLKVAVIGAGPSGLSCSYYLALEGFQVTIYETKAFAGGMVGDAIPAFRITQEAINKDIERIKSIGVHIIFNSKVDKSTFEQIRKKNNFIFIAVGAQKAKSLSLKDIEAKGVLDPLDFLSAVKKGKPLIHGNKVAVVGGGNTAFDVARTAKRIVGEKGKVAIIYRRTIKDMPADEEEIKAALAEKIEIVENVLPEQILSKGNKMVGLSCVKMQPGEIDSSGRAKPVKVENSDFVMEFETLISALGQEIEVEFLEEKPVRFSDNSYKTQYENIFIGGDAIRGASTVIKAIADGRLAAVEIINHAIKKYQFIQKTEKKHSYTELMIMRSRRQYKNIPSKNFKPPFISINQAPAPGLTLIEAVSEASRCLHCDELCNICVTVCPNRAIFPYTTLIQKLLLQKAVLKNNKEVVFEDDDEMNISQSYQVLNIADLCNECGNCTTFCPTSGKPFADKPRFFISIEKFRQSNSGFFLSKLEKKTVLIKKEQNTVSTLSYDGDKLIYENESVLACFLNPGFELIHVRFFDRNLTKYHFKEAAEMYVLFNAIKALNFL